MDYRMISTGGLFIAIAVMCQTCPAVFSEAFVLVSLLSALPVYVASRLVPKLGVMVFLGTAMVTFFISFHEGLFFVLTNGPFGLILGIVHGCLKKYLVAWITSGGALAGTMLILDNVFKVQVFGYPLGLDLFSKFVFFLGFALIYSNLYLRGADLLYRKLERSNMFNGF